MTFVQCRTLECDVDLYLFDEYMENYIKRITVMSLSLKSFSLGNQLQSELIVRLVKLNSPNRAANVRICWKCSFSKKVLYRKFGSLYGKWEV